MLDISISKQLAHVISLNLHLNINLHIIKNYINILAVTLYVLSDFSHLNNEILFLNLNKF